MLGETRDTMIYTAHREIFNTIKHERERCGHVMGWNVRNWCTLGLLTLKDVAQPGMNLREVMKGAMLLEQSMCGREACRRSVS